jgi:hypothetical protein
MSMILKEIFERDTGVLLIPLCATEKAEVS